MGERALGQRGALSGGFSSALAVVSGVAAQEAAAARLGCREEEKTDGTDAARETADQDETERAALHAPFQAEFLAWLSEVADRFALPVSVDVTGAGFTGLRLGGVNPAIGVTLTDDWQIIAWIDESDGVPWDHLLWSDAVAEPAPGGVGWVNALVFPEHHVIHPSPESVWRADAFEGLLAWVNGRLALATHVELCGDRDGCTWAWLVRDGVVLRTGWSLTTEGKPERLLPAHGWMGAMIAAAETTGQTRHGNQDGEASMAIGNAVQRGNFVYVYDEKGRQLAALPAGSGPEDGLKGYTGATVSVRRGSFVYTYDERGRQVSTTPAR